MGINCLVIDIGSIVTDEYLIQYYYLAGNAIITPVIDGYRGNYYNL